MPHAPLTKHLIPRRREAPNARDQRDILACLEIERHRSPAARRPSRPRNSDRARAGLGTALRPSHAPKPLAFGSRPDTIQ